MGLKKGMTNNVFGRPSGSKNKKTQEVQDFLELHKIEILKLAYERAKAGSDMILSKILDKIAPSLAHNKNEEIKTFEDFLLDRRKKLQEKSAVNENNN